MQTPPRATERSGRSLQKLTALLDVYPVRMMAAMSTSLAVVLLAVHLPLHRLPPAIGWQTASSSLTLLTLHDVIEQQDEVRSGVPITRFDGEQDTGEGEAEPPTREEEAPPPEQPALARLQTRQAALEFSEVQPQVKGGLGAYYINIDYPEAARNAGIEGRLVLAFVVEKDGTSSQVSLLKPLHPLLDSAAVRALRRTRFIPGEQNGELVRVKMRLPVRFQIVNPPSSKTVATGPDPAGDGS